MNTQQALLIQQTVAGSYTGTMTFPQVVMQLAGIGVERYHVDYSRHELTYYWRDGQSLVVTMPLESSQTGDAFFARDVEAAVRQSQRGEHTYVDFIHKTMAAGCVGYFVQITGRCAIYFGRHGESHVERFPD